MCTNLIHLIERLHSQTALFTKRTLKFLPDLPTVEEMVEGVLSTGAEQAATEPAAPPVVENGRFSGFFFGDDLKEDDDK